MIIHVVPGLLYHIPVDQLERYPPIGIFVFIRKNTNNEVFYQKLTSNDRYNDGDEDDLALGL